ncbi:hypothetical protein BDZ89DRAFT_1065630, partial [Hymenopellis radicata]
MPGPAHLFSIATAKSLYTRRAGRVSSASIIYLSALMPTGSDWRTESLIIEQGLSYISGGAAAS